MNPILHLLYMLYLGGYIPLMNQTMLPPATTYQNQPRSQKQGQMPTTLPNPLAQLGAPYGLKGEPYSALPYPATSNIWGSLPYVGIGAFDQRSNQT